MGRFGPPTISQTDSTAGYPSIKSLPYAKYISIIKYSKIPIYTYPVNICPAAHWIYTSTKVDLFMNSLVKWTWRLWKYRECFRV